MMLVMMLPSIGNKANAADGGISVTTDKFVYRPGEDVGFNISLDSGGRNLSGDLIVRVYAAADLLGADPFSGQPVSEAALVKGGNLPGQGNVAARASLSDLKVGPGGFPYRISLVSDGQETLAGTGWLAVVDPAAREPLDLVLLWTAGSPPVRDQSGIFMNMSLADRCRDKPRTADTLLQPAELAAQYPKVKTTYAIEASLLEQLGDMADGFDLADGGNIVSFPADSDEANAASSCLAGFKTLAESPSVEILATPYTFASLPMLAKQGWDDGTGQYRIGQDVLLDALSLPAAPRGSYAPGLDVTTDSLRYLAATGGEFTVLSGSIRDSVQGRLPAGEPGYRLRDLSGERITGFFANDNASAALFSDFPDPAAFFASIANAYTGGSKLAIAASPSPNPVLSAEQRQKVYATLAQEPWINDLTLTDAKVKYRPSSQPMTLLRYVDPTAGYLGGTYYQKLDAAHERFEDFRAAVDSEVAEMMSLAREMFTAESIYYVGGGSRPEAANQGLTYIDSISRFTASQFSRLEIKVDTPLLQSSSGGEAAVTLTNANPYEFTLDLVLEADGVEFPEGSEQRLRLQPGSTVIKVPYRSDGWSRIDALLQSRGHTLVEDSAGIHLITSRGWFVILFALAALAAGIIYVIVVTRRR